MTATEFQTIILPAYGAMETVARRMLGDSDRAADVVQDVMRTLWEARSRLEVTTCGAAYAIRATRNRCLDVLRRPSSRTVSIDGDEVSAAVLAVADDEPDSTQQRVEALVVAIEKLGEPRRTIVRMSLEGRSGAEISDATGLTQPNVRQMLSRARKELRKYIVQS